MKAALSKYEDDHPSAGKQQSDRDQAPTVRAQERYRIHKEVEAIGLRELAATLASL